MLKKKIATISILSVLGFIVSFVSQLVISYYYGATSSLDAFYICIAIINFLIFPLTPFKEALTPQFHSRLKESKVSASNYLSVCITLILMVMIFGLIIGFLFEEYILDFIVSNERKSTKSIATDYLVILLPSALLYSLSEVLNSVLPCFNRVILQTGIRIIGTITALTVICLFVGLLETKVLPFSFLLSQLVMVIIQLIYIIKFEGLNLRIRYPINLDKKYLTAAGLLFVAYGVNQFYSLFEKQILSHFTQGTISAYQYAVSLTNVPVSIFGVTISNIIWPRLLAKSSEVSNNDFYNEIALISKITIIILGLVCGSIWLNAHNLVDIIYHRGAFDDDAVIKTTYALRIVIFSAIPISIGLIIWRALMSIKATKLVMYSGLVTSFIGIFILLMSSLLNNKSIAFSHWIIANLFGTLCYAYYLANLCNVNFKRQLNSLKWMIKWILIMVVTLYLLELFINNSLLSTSPFHQLAISTFIWFCVYLGIIHLCKCVYIKDVIKLLRI